MKFTLIVIAAAVIAPVMAIACGHEPVPPPAAPREGDDELVTVDEETTADDEPEADASPPPRPRDVPDYYAAAVRNATDVFRSMRPDFRTCYAAKLAANPNAHAALVFNVLIGPKGAVRTVDMTGGALLGEDGRECLAAFIRKATFTPVHGGGTLRIKVPMEFRAVLAVRDAGARAPK